MCNDYRSHVSAQQIRDGFSQNKIRITFPEGAPNLEPRDDIRITDPGAIVRAADGPRGQGELVQRRWSWPAPNGKPVYNFRSEGREFRSGRCLIVMDGFYEFTAPTEPGKKRKDKWLFKKRDEPWFCVAGIWRTDPSAGEAFTMLTVEPGPDVAPYHSRQIAVLSRADWADWLDHSISARSILKPLAAGSLEVAQVG
jgi:putative SOS response-associated peptidase YedK